MAMDEAAGYAGEVDEAEEDDEALDAALDMELAATYVKHPAAIPPSPSPPKEHQPATSQLTFAFPGWEIGISKSERLTTPSVSRIAPEPSQPAPSKKVKTSMSALDDRVEGCPVAAMDDDLLASVLMKLDMKSLRASMRTCKRWHRVACKEDVWAHILMPGVVSGCLPRWMEVRNASVWMAFKMRFLVFKRGYEFVRSALTAWWEHGEPDGQHPPAVFRSLQKLVIDDWSLLYEALGVAFSDRADRVAVPILGAIERIREVKRREMGAAGEEREETMWDEGEVQEVWVLVLSLWRRYKRWLMLVVSHCPELNHEVMAERARSNALAMTPTVYGKGIICFRSQVILKYGIRSVLQATWAGLASAKRSGTASDNQLDLFRSADHLFQEASVQDDLTLSPTTFTQQKLRRCFGNETANKTKPRGKLNAGAEALQMGGWK